MEVAPFKVPRVPRDCKSPGNLEWGKEMYLAYTLWDASGRMSQRPNYTV